MKITEEMVMELNEELRAKGCSFRYLFDAYGNPKIRITLPSMNCVDSFIINPTREFFTWIEQWFKLKGIELCCNADGSILWSENGYDD